MMSWSLGSDFLHNPSSVWSYGSKPAGYQVTGALSLFTHLDSEPKGSGVVAWFGNDTVWYTKWMGVYYNTKSTTTIVDGNMFTANGVSMHPGGDGIFSVVRFTAPKDGNYTLDATFTHANECANYTG